MSLLGESLGNNITKRRQDIENGVDGVRTMDPGGSYSIDMDSLTMSGTIFSLHLVLSYVI